jgi:RNA polymerase sigma factor (sigma-70 family)
MWRFEPILPESKLFREEIRDFARTPLSFRVPPASNEVEQRPSVMQRPIDREQLDRMVVDHLPASLRFAQRLTGRSDEAEELVQESLYKVLNNWRYYRGEATFSTWMLGIVLNTYRDWCRRRPPPGELPANVVDNRPGVECFADASELAERVRQAIDQLPDRQREVALLCLVEHIPPVEAAEVLGLSTGNIHTTLHLIRKKLLPLASVEPSCRHD